MSDPADDLRQAGVTARMMGLGFRPTGTGDADHVDFVKTYMVGPSVMRLQVAMRRASGGRPPEVGFFILSSQTAYTPGGFDVKMLPPGPSEDAEALQSAFGAALPEFHRVTRTCASCGSAVHEFVDHKGRTLCVSCYDG